MSTARKLLLTVAGASAALALSGGGTFASFTASTSNDANTFETGTLLLTNTVGETTCFSTAAEAATDTNTASCAALFDVPIEKPGDSGSATVTLANAGSVDGTLSVATTDCTGSVEASPHGSDADAFCDALVLTVSDGGAEPLYEGTVGAFDAADLADLAGGEDLALSLTVALPHGENDNALQGLGASFGLTWTLDQA